MVADVLHAVALLGVSVENPADQILALAGEELGKRVVSTHDLLVEVARLRVFKRQIAADHGVEDDTGRPDVRFEAVIPLAGDHLGRSVAGRAASSLQGGSRLVHI